MLSGAFAGRGTGSTLHFRRVFWISFALAALIGAAAAVHFSQQDLTLSHYDSRGHLIVARRTVDSLTPGWRQLGAVWLPLPHLINLAPVQIDAAYRSGSTAVAASILVLAWGLASLGVLLYRRTGSVAASAIAPLAILINPNVLYLQSTPMTEALLIGVSLIALRAVEEWLADPPRFERRAGWALAALVLTRYEGWFVAAGLVALAALAVTRVGLRRLAALAAWPATAAGAFLVLSWASTGSWFVASGFFVPDNPARHQPLVALAQVGQGLGDLGGASLVVLGAAGLAGLAWQSRRSFSLVLPLALVAAALLPWAAFTAGHPYRIRYMVPLVAAAGALAACGLPAIPARLRAIGAVAILVTAVLSRPPLDPTAPMVLEAQWDVPNREARTAVSLYLRQHHDGSPVLASMGSLGHYMHEAAAAGLDLGDFLHEGNGDLWAAALDAPRRLVRWVLVEERAEGGDMLYERARRDPEFLEGFSRVAEGGGVALYEAR